MANSNLKCIGCKATLLPAAQDVQFITCNYCRKTNKNPNFREVIKPTPTPVQNQQFTQNTSNTDAPRSSHNTQDAAFLGAFLSSLLMPRRARRRRRFRRGRTRRSGCGGCGCGCLVIFIGIPLFFSLVAAISGYLPEIIAFITDLWNQLISS